MNPDIDGLLKFTSRIGFSTYSLREGEWCILYPKRIVLYRDEQGAGIGIKVDEVSHNGTESDISTKVKKLLGLGDIDESRS